MTEYYKEIWGRHELLRGLDDDVADKVAFEFAHMANDMSTCEPYIKNYSWDYFVIIAFPMLRRIITECPDYTYEKFLKYMKGIDFEGELIDALCDKIIAKEKGRVKEVSK